MQGKFEQARENLKNMQETTEMYESIMHERRRFLTFQFMYRSPNDVEEMIKALFGHFEVIRKTCLNERARENFDGIGSEEILSESSAQLKLLEKELKAF